MLRTLIEEGKQVSMIISGSSMAPFLIHARDHICLERPSGELRKGDMVFYQRSNGEYVMHRIYNVKKEDIILSVTPRLSSKAQFRENRFSPSSPR